MKKIIFIFVLLVGSIAWSGETSKNEKWDDYSSQGRSIHKTQNWFESSMIESNKSFTLKYPADWTVVQTVFDQNGKKIAEFSPGLIILKQGQKCFDNIEAYKKESVIDIINNKPVKIGKYSGRLLIMNVHMHGSRTVHTYCIDDGTLALKMSFYGVDEALAEKILATVKFK